MYTELSMTAQTAYAQLADAVAATDLVRTVSNVTGSFASKQVKGRTYWYFQYTLPGKKTVQSYVGPDSERVRNLIDSKLQKHPSAEQIQRLANAAEALGGQPLLRPHFRVINRLSEFGFFHAGGVLVGTHAFLAYGNMLGVHWGDSARTQDVDFAHAGKNISIALPNNLEVNTPGALDSLEMGFLPISGASYLKADEPDFQLDFLTTLHRGGQASYTFPPLKIPLQPVKFLEYALVDIQQATVFCSSGATAVNVPHPARYALAKLLVSANRPANQAVKANKDLSQSAALLTYYRTNSSWMVDDAWQDLIGRGPGWRSRAREGLAALDRLAPELEVGSWLEIPVG